MLTMHCHHPLSDELSLAAGTSTRDTNNNVHICEHPWHSLQLDATDREEDIPQNSILGPRDAQSRRLTSIHAVRVHMIACSGNHLG